MRKGPGPPLSSPSSFHWEGASRRASRGKGRGAGRWGETLHPTPGRQGSEPAATPVYSAPLWAKNLLVPWRWPPGWILRLGPLLTGERDLLRPYYAREWVGSQNKDTVDIQGKPCGGRQAGWGSREGPGEEAGETGGRGTGREQARQGRSPRQDPQAWVWRVEPGPSSGLWAGSLQA